MSLVAELRRRNVFRVGIAYAVAAWLLLQLTEVLTGLLELPTEIGKTVVVLLLIGFVPAVIFAWAFELTPEGLKREKDVDRHVSVTPRTGRTLDRIIIALLGVVVVWFLVDEFYLEPRQETMRSAADPSSPAAVGTDQAGAGADGPSVAVLPFVNMSADPDNEYFSDGLTETLLHMLAQLPDLRVAARTSSFSFKGKDASIADISAALNVAHVLEGSVQRADGQVRVTAQLIRAGDGFHVWSQSYTRPLEGLFAIQDEIATDVARALDASLLRDAERMQGPDTQDLDAFETYLKALDEQSSFSYASLEAAEGLFKQALAEDPEFLDAQVGLARNYLLMNNTGLINHDEMSERITPLLAQIRTQHPENPQARAFELITEGRRPGLLTAEEGRELQDELLRILSVIPDEVFVRINAAGLTAFLDGDPQGALDILLAGLLVDPRSALLRGQIGQAYVELGQYEEAKKELQLAAELDPSLPGTFTRLAGLARAQNDLPESLRWMRRAIDVDPQDHELVVNLARVFYNLHLLEEGDRWARRVAALMPGSDFVASLAIRRAEAAEDWSQVVQLARELIESDATRRVGVYGDAMGAYADAELRLGEARAAYDYLVDRHPEVAQYADPPTSPAVLDLRMYSLYLLLDFAPGEASEAWKHAKEHLLALGFDWAQEPHLRMFDRVIDQDFDGAVPHALEVLEEPLAQDPLQLSQFRLPYLAPLTEVPAVARKLQEKQATWDAMREDVIAMLREPEWQ